MEYVYTQAQTVDNGTNILFNNKYENACNQNIYHDNETGVFTLNPVINNPVCNRFAQFDISCVCNIAVPTGGTVGEIAIALVVDGGVDPSTMARFTPAAVDTFGNVTIMTSQRVNARCCKNIGFQVVAPSGGSVVVQEANASIRRVS